MLVVPLRRGTDLVCRNEASFKSIPVVGWYVAGGLPLMHGPSVVVLSSLPSFGYLSHHVCGGVRMYVYARRMTTGN